MLLLLGFALPLSAQMDPSTLLRTGHGRLSANPGTPAPHRFYFGAGVGNAGLEFAAGPFSYNRIVLQGEDGHKHLDVDRLVPALKVKGDLTGGLDLRMELLGAGFSIGNFYVDFSLQLRSENVFRLPGEALSCLLDGSAVSVGESVSSGISFRSGSFLESGFLFQKSFLNKFTLGIRPKYLVGLAQAETNKGELRIHTDGEMNLYVGGKADFQLLYPDIRLLCEDGTWNSGRLYAAMQMCRGFGVDFGGDVMISDRIGFSLSLLDVGSMRWNGRDGSCRKRLTVGVNPDAPNYEDGYLVFKDEQRDVFHQMLDGEMPFESLKDSLEMWFVYQWEEVDDRMPPVFRLTPKMVAGLRYAPTPKHTLSASLRADFMPEKGVPSVMLGYDGSFSFFDFALSYTLFDVYGRKNLLGVGWDFKSGPFRWTLALYNLKLDWSERSFNWRNMRQIALKAGIYCAIGRRNPYDKDKEKQ